MSGKKRVYPLFETVETESRSSGSDIVIYSWNVAGLRACVKKSGAERIGEFDADVVLLQETKCNDLPDEVACLSQFPFKKIYPSKEKKGGYSGVALLSRYKPKKVVLGIGDKRFDDQGRWLHAEFDDFHLVNVYVPNSGRGLVNLALRHEWEELVLQQLEDLDKEKPVIYAGDLNVAHEEIDLKNPKSNANKTAGFTDQERNDFSRLLDSGFVDVFRRLYPDKENAYTYWSYFMNSRAKNVGWRLDYFVVSERVFENVEACQIHSDVMGSDHCPISLRIKI